MALLLLFHVLKKIHAQKNVLVYEKNCLSLGKKLFFFFLAHSNRIASKAFKLLYNSLFV